MLGRPEPQIRSFMKYLKQLIDYIKYTKDGSYDPQAYWESRHAKYTDDRAVANELEPEKQRYDEQRKQFLKFLNSEDVRLKGSKCLEFGCGNAFWAETVLSEGASKYLGLDISKTAIERCSAKNLSNASFACLDVSTEPFETAEKYDVGFSIDVTQHIVDEQKLKLFLANLQSSVKPGGHLILTSYKGYGDRFIDEETHKTVAGIIKVPKFRWVHTWDLPTIEHLLPNCRCLGIAKFWDKVILHFQVEKS